MYNDYPLIKMIGGCFGAQLIAQALGGKIEKMVLAKERPKIIGRELIKLTDAFFEQEYVKKYMLNKELTKESFPPLVL